MRLRAVEQLDIVVVFVSVFARDVVFARAVVEQVVLFAPNVDCNVKVANIDAEGREYVEFETEVQAEREVDIEGHILCDLELALHCAEDAAQNVAERFVHAAVLLVEFTVDQNEQAVVFVEFCQIVLFGDFDVVALELLVGNAFVLDKLKRGLNFSYALVHFCVILIREVNLSCLEEQTASQRERNVVEIVGINVLFVCVICIFGF